MPKEGLWSKNYLRVFLSNLLLMGINNMVPSLFVLFLYERGGTDMDAGLAAYLFSFASLFARPLAGRLLDTRERRVITLLCLALLAVFHLGFLIIPVLVFLLVNRALTGFFLGIASTALTTNASTRAWAISGSATPSRPPSVRRSVCSSLIKAARTCSFP